MDVDSPSIAQELTLSDLLDEVNNDPEIDHLDTPLACVLCHRILSQERAVDGGLQIVGVCGDCKFLLLEDFGSPASGSRRRRRPRRRRRTTYGSSESIENPFSQQFSQMINLARNYQSESENLLGGADSGSRSVQQPSSHTTPLGSRRWRRVTSDAESDGFDNTDSFYGESDSNVSFSAYRAYLGDSDAISFSFYGGDSDASVDGHSFLDGDTLIQSLERSDIDYDTDIDPMHAGLINWNSEDQEGEEGDEWEEARHLEAGAPTERSGTGDHSTRYRRSDSPEFDSLNSWRLGESEHAEIPSIFSNLEESGETPYLGNPGDYLDARGFEQFLEHLVEADSSRRGAPPAAMSFVNSLPLVIINEEHQKPDGLACAICKEFLLIGTEANQLPCLHVYHPSCILPWLTARNSCPLCRYELPTDDMDYEEGKHAANRRMYIRELQQHDGRDDSSSTVTDASEVDAALEPTEELRDVEPAADRARRNGERGRWLVLAAAPLVSLLGVALVLWGRGLIGQRSFHNQPQSRIQTSGSYPSNQRERRWWWF